MATKTFGISMVKDEADIIPYTLGWMVQQVDHIIIADNDSHDDTREWIQPFVDLGSVSLLRDAELAYYQSKKMTDLAALAARWGADWVVPFDADELWYTTSGRRIADVLANHPRITIAEAQIYDHVATGADIAWEKAPTERIQWRKKDPEPLVKVACRPSLPVVIEQGNHGARYDGNISDGLGLRIRHYPYRSPEQYVSKIRNGAAAYAATDLPLAYGDHWRRDGHLLETYGEDFLKEQFYTHHYVEHPEADTTVVHDPMKEVVPA